MDQQLIRAMLDVDEHHWWYRGRREIVRVELDRLPLPVPAVTLDAGCGSGRGLHELERYGTVVGVELNAEAAEVARSRGVGDVLVGRLEELPWPAATFDLITSLDVIEHTPDDVVALAELARVTKPGGWLLVTVPAYQALWAPHDVANHHYRRYSRRGLRASAAAAGWRIERMTSFNSVLLPPAAAVRIAQRRRLLRSSADGRDDLHVGPAWLNGVLERPMLAEARWLRRGRTLPAGLSLLGVFQKPRDAV
jgi:SAM-dependent methyltransferase